MLQPTNTIKAISLWQPWATLIALGAKTYETRSWPTSYRGTLAIHASKNTSMHGICYEPYFCDWLAKIHCPLGAIVALVALVDCVPTESIANQLSPQELAFGDYTPGRFAWKLENIRPLPAPIPCTGRQGLFNIPGEMIRGLILEVLNG